MSIVKSQGPNTVVKWIAAALLASLSVFAATTSTTPDNSPEALLRRGHADDAIKLLQQKLNADAGSAESHNLLSRVYLSVGKIDSAIKEGEAAVQKDPNNSNYHLWLGRAYGQKAEKANPFAAIGLAKRTREQFEKAVELNASDTLARTDLAEFYLESPSIVGGGRDKAEQQAQALAQRDQPASLWVQARLDEKAKDVDAAEKHYKDAIAASKNDATYWVSLASFYRRQNRLNDMEDAIRKASSAHKSKGNVFVDAASLLVRTGRSLPDAAQLLAKYLGSASSQTEEAPAFQAHYMLGQILEKQGDPVAARKEYEAALKLASDYSPARDALRRVQSK